MARLRLIYRTQSELAAGRRQYEEDTDPAQLAAFPAWRFVRQPGAKTKREDHVEHEGDVRLISDTEYWLARNSPDFGGFNQPFPPWGFNSWMRVFPVSRAECEQLGLLTPSDPPPAIPTATRLRYTLPDALAAADSASLDSLPPLAQDAVRSACRDLGIELRPRADLAEPQTETTRETAERTGGGTTGTVPLRDPRRETASLVELAALHQLVLRLVFKNKPLPTAKQQTPPPPPPAAAPPSPQPPTPPPAPQPHETWQTLNLESVSQFPAEKGKTITGKDVQNAYKKINNGFTLDSEATINGEKQTITVNSRLLNHWKIKNKNAQDLDRRMEVFDEVLRTLKEPEEVWEQPNGVRVYLRAVEIDGKRIYLNGVVVDPDNTVVSFIRTKSPNYVNNKRYGKLFYKKN